MRSRFNSLLIAAIVSCGTLHGQTTPVLSGTHQARPGYGTIVNLKFPRNGIKGVVRFSHPIPAGWQVQAFTKESDYTISVDGNTVRILWLSVPLLDTLSCSWFLKIPAEETGSFTLNGKLKFYESGAEREVAADPFFIKMNKYYSRLFAE